MSRTHPFLDALHQYFTANPDASEWRGGSYAMVDLMSSKRYASLPGYLQRWAKLRLCAEVLRVDKYEWVFYRDAVIEYCKSDNSVQ